jgi:quercetin dioxygenase-like cupin family protein
MPPAEPPQPYVLPAGSGWTYRFGIDFDVKAGEVAAGRGAAVVEYHSHPGEEPPDHTHATEDEMFYVLEGALTFRCAGRSFEAEPGAFVFLPRGLEHGYTIHPNQPVRLLAVTCPVRAAAGGWGGFIADLETGQGELIAQPPAADH